MTQNIGQITLEQDLESENCTKEEQLFGANTFFGFGFKFGFLIWIFLSERNKAHLLMTQNIGQTTLEQDLENLRIVQKRSNFWDKYFFGFGFLIWIFLSERNRAHVLMTQLDRTLAKSLHCQLGNLRSHVSSSHIVPVTQSKHKSLVPHSLIIQTWSLLLFLGCPMHLNFLDNILTN